MLSKTRGIVLHSLSYNDKYSIVHIYTESFGRAAYLVARNRGRKSTVSKALFMPLSVLDMEVEHLPKRDLNRIREAKLYQSNNNICCDPVKNVLALFLAEVLYRVIREAEPDVRLFDYLCTSIQFLEVAEKGVANYHLVFLLHLLNFLGIFPNTGSYTLNAYFDMMNGVFTTNLPSHRHYLNRQESKIFARLFRISFENMGIYAFSRQERVNIVHRILDYYRLHIPDGPEIKSLAVMQSLFD